MNMHEPYDEDDEYDDDQYNYDYKSNPFQWYYKFDVGPDSPISKWMDDLINDIIKNTNQDYNPNNIFSFKPIKFPVNSWNPNTGKDNTYQYLGSNYHGEPIWKKKYFIHNKLQTDYVLHLQNYVTHTVSQPSYYKGIFDILN